MRKIFHLIFWEFAFLFAGIHSRVLAQRCLIQILKKHFENESLLVVSGFAESQSKEPKSLPGNGGNRKPPFGEELLKVLMNSLAWSLQVSRPDERSDPAPDARFNRVDNCLVMWDERDVETEEGLREEIGKLKENPLWNSSGKNLIVVNRRSPKALGGDEKLASEIIGKLWKATKASRNLIMFFDAEGIVDAELYTWFPFRKPDCSSVEKIIRLEACENVPSEVDDDLFPGKLMGNLNECEIVAATDQCVPFVFSHDESGYLGKGVEIQLMNTLAESLNFRLNLVQRSDVGLTTVNGTPAGVFQLLSEQKIDVAFSCLMLNRERYLVAGALHPYLYDSLVWFVPSPIVVTHASDLFFTFDRSVWSIIIVVAVVSSLVVVFSKRSSVTSRSSRSTSDSFFKVVAMSLSTSVRFPAAHPSLKIFTFIFYVYSFHLAAYFQSSLYEHFKEPTFAGIYDSVEEAVDDGMFIYLYRSTEEFYNQTNHGLWDRILRPGRYAYIEDFGEAFREIAEKRNAIALYIHFAGAYMVTAAYRDGNDFPKISSLEEKFSPYPVTMYLSPGNPIFPLFQTRIHRIISSGLLNYWVENVIGSKRFVKPRDLLLVSAHDMWPLSWRHLNGSFFVLCILHSFALLVFILELFTFSSYLDPRRRRIDAKLRTWVEESSVTFYYRHFFPAKKFSR